MRGLETLHLKWDVSIKSLPSGLRELYRRGGGKTMRARGDGGTKKTRFSKQKVIPVNLERQWQQE